MEKVKLGTLIDDYGDGIHGTPVYDNNGDFYFVNGNNIRSGKIEIDDTTQKISKSEYDKIKRPLGNNTILVSINGTLGSVGIYNNEKIALGKSIAYLNVKNEDDKYFVKYILESKEFQKYIGIVAHGSTIKNLAPSQIPDFDMPVFTDSQKVLMVKTLLPIDEKIMANNDVIKNTELLLKNIYEFWFYQFDFPNKEGKPYKSNNGEIIYDESVDRSYPKGWKYQTIYENDLFNLVQTGVDYFETKNYLATKNVVGNDFTDGNDVTYDNREDRANMQPVVNSVWFAKLKNSVKHLTLTEIDGWFIEKYILSTGFTGLKCKDQSLAYVHCFINSDHFEYWKDILSHGATQEGVNNDDLKSIKLLIPSFDILEKFNSIALPLIEKINSVRKENYELKKLKDYLLPQFMNFQFNK